MVNGKTPRKPEERRTGEQNNAIEKVRFCGKGSTPTHATHTTKYARTPTSALRLCTLLMLCGERQRTAEAQTRTCPKDPSLSATPDPPPLPLLLHANVKKARRKRMRIAAIRRRIQRSQLRLRGRPRPPSARVRKLNAARR